MPDVDQWGKKHSPFHPGEQTIQSRLGVREQMENFARRVVRPFLPDQHQKFYEGLPFVAVGSVDEAGWPWASLVCGHPGFLHALDSTHLVLEGAIAPGHPLRDALKPDGRLGVLGIDLATRRRNRVNVTVLKTEGSKAVLHVDQAFGNCPQYIQTRAVQFIRAPDDFGHTSHETLETLSDADKKAIQRADTFFVASYLPPEGQHDIEGVDVSHRGGRPGFVKVTGNTLTIPDYVGNLHFNTLGNFLANPKAGLIFPDFTTGDVLMLTGTTEILWEDSPEVKAFQGAERAWRFHLHRSLRMQDAIPLRWTFLEWSPNTLITGTWDQAHATLQAEELREAWRDYRVIRIEDESSEIRSFYLEPNDNAGLSAHEAGQYLTLRVTLPGQEKALFRTYTLSSAPNDPQYRISVKREAEGTVSRYLHDRMRPGDTLSAKAPRGDFWLDASARRPAVLLAAGVGITPMISMARHAAREGLRTRYLRPLTVLHSARTERQRAFADTFRRLEAATDGAIRYVSIVSRPEAQAKDFDVAGRLDQDLLRRHIAVGDSDFFLCGPGGYMQSTYDALRSLGVPDERIFAESFGPAVLKRWPDPSEERTHEVSEAREVLVHFAKSGFEQRWSQRVGTLLELAEAHGLTPAYSCRRGACGTCATRLLAGRVAYRTQPTASVKEGEVLICCAVPAEKSDELSLHL
jgi:uncharacterized protein